MTTFSRNSLLGLGALLLFAAWSLPARADIEGTSAGQFFGISSAYNDVFLGNYYGNEGDIEGHAAVGGNLTAINYGFGSGEMATHADNKNVLVVGGDVYAKGAGVYDGNAYIAGSINPTAVNGKTDKWNTVHASDRVIAEYNQGNPNYQAEKGTIYANSFPTGNPDTIQNQKWFSESGYSTIPFDFTVAKEQLQTASSQLWNYQDTLTASFNDRNIVIDLAGLTGLQVLTLDAVDFMNMGDNRNIYINNAGADLTLLINITNELNSDYLWLRNEIVINGVADPMYADFDGSNILLNTDMENVRIENVAFNGSLVALNAEVYVREGNIDGQVFAGSGYTERGGEFHAHYTFDDRHLTNATPEPASMLIFGAGLVGLAAVRRFRKGK